MKKLTAYGLVIGSALAASLAFSEAALADMSQAGDCGLSAAPVCDAQIRPSQDGPTSMSSNRTAKPNDFNKGNGFGTDNRQDANSTGPADQRQNAGAASSRGEGGDRGGGNRSSGRR